MATSNWNLNEKDERPVVELLLHNIKKELPNLTELLIECANHGAYEDKVYRFYHQSIKTFSLQIYTIQIVDMLESLLPNHELNGWFTAIVQEGTGKEFRADDNGNWLVATRPILEAFFHAKYFLEMIVKYGNELDTPPNALPSGWAAVLHLYRIR